MHLAGVPRLIGFLPKTLSHRYCQFVRQRHCFSDEQMSANLLSPNNLTAVPFLHRTTCNKDWGTAERR